MLAIYDKVITMSNKRNFDTLAYANRLKIVGVPEKQAELQAEMQAETINKINEIIHEKIATKRDLKELELKIARDMKELELKITRDMKELELNLDLKLNSKMITLGGSLGGIIVAGFTVLGILIKLH
jgi:hypothetical protein